MTGPEATQHEKWQGGGEYFYMNKIQMGEILNNLVALALWHRMSILNSPKELLRE